MRTVLERNFYTISCQLQTLTWLRLQGNILYTFSIRDDFKSMQNAIALRRINQKMLYSQVNFLSLLSWSLIKTLLEKTHS